MENLTIVLAFISTIISSCSSLLYGYIALKKLKEPPKDEIWETATKLVCNNESLQDADNFAFVYEQLKYFKDNGCSMQDINSLLFAVREKNSKQS